MFREHGLPEAIRGDNVSPFASLAMGGLSRLAVWGIKLGIRPGRFGVGYPKQNGRHEWMHRTLKQGIRLAEDRLAQQRELDRFRPEYNRCDPPRGPGNGDAR
jgi:putative transposase